jgi:hypothetical protein
MDQHYPQWGDVLHSSSTGRLLESTRRSSANYRSLRVSTKLADFSPLAEYRYLFSVLNGEGINSEQPLISYLTLYSPWKSAHVIVPLCLGAVMVMIFVVWESFAPYPMIPAWVFKNKLSDLGTKH